MSDVVAAALIAGAVGLLGTAATLILTRWNMTAQARQRDQVRDDAARQARQDNYANLAWDLQRLHKYAAFGRPPDKGDWEDWLDHYALNSGVVLIVCSTPVAEAVNAFTAALEQAAPEFRDAVAEIESGVVSVPDPWLLTYRRHQKVLDASRLELLRRMQQDAGPG